MAEETRRPALHQLKRIGERSARRADEVAKARVGRAEKAPADAQRHKREDGVADRLMQCLQVLARPDEAEERDQRPVEGAHERVPNPDGLRPHLAAGFRCVSSLGRHQLRSLRPMISAVAGSMYISTLAPLASVPLTS